MPDKRYHRLLRAQMFAVGSHGLWCNCWGPSKPENLKIFRVEHEEDPVGLETMAGGIYLAGGARLNRTASCIRCGTVYGQGDAPLE